MTTEPPAAAQLAYEAYVSAKPHPETALDWDELDDAYVAAWEAALAAAQAALTEAAAQERERILAGVNRLRDVADKMSDNAGDYMLKIGFQAQQEVLDAVRVLIAGTADGADPPGGAA